MREILFRGKRLDNGGWCYGYYVHTRKSMRAKGQTITESDFDHDYIIDFRSGEKHEVDLATVGQYTGLEDKNGTRIFEGDIVSMRSYGGGKRITNVYFHGGKFAVDGSNYSYKDIAGRTTEVIGNIYDNPELPGGDKK